MSTSPTGNPHASWGKRLLAFLLWGLLATIFGLVGWFFMLKPVAVAAGNWSLARDYQPVQATVVKQTGKDDAGTFDWYSARYESGGKTYETNRLSVLEDEAIDERFNATVLKKLEQANGGSKQAEIWVSPRKPDVAVVSRDFPFSSLWAKMLVGAGFGIFALAGVAGMLGAITGLGYYRNLFDAAPLWGFGAAWCGFIFPIMLLVTNEDRIEWVAVGIVGLFALIGVFIMWAAIAVSLHGARSTGADSARPGAKLSTAALATSFGADRKKAVKGQVKRGGLGGRTGDFDRN